MKVNTNQDSLDYQKQLYQRAQSGYSQSPKAQPNFNQNQIYKNFYKQELDDLVRQKNEKKRLQKQQQAKDRNIYNDRISYGVQAEKMKDLSYKNYYQTLLNNQANLSKNFVAPFYERDAEKDKLIYNGIEQQKKRSQMWHDQELRKNQVLKKQYREDLTDQLNKKYYKNAVDTQIKAKQSEEYKQIVYTPQELAKFQRERKLMEMQRYKEDLDKTNPMVNPSRNRSNTGPYIKNDFNILKVEDRHNPMVNPIPYNIQNPYILKEMQRKQLQSGHGQEHYQMTNNIY